MFNRRKLILTGAAAALGAHLAGPAALAQAPYPVKPVRIISDSAAGSSNDVLIRVVADQLGQLWGQQPVVANHPGAGGGVSVGVAKQAEPDGYTLYIPAASTFLAIRGAPGVSPNLPIELPKDFLPIGLMMTQPMFIGVSHKLGVSTVPELIKLAKQRPGDISFAATGRGRITHLAMELFQDMAGVKLTFVPYTGGPAAAMNDVTSGRVGIVLDGYPGVGGAIEGNIIKGLAAASDKRLRGFENLPTVAETLPGFRAGGWSVVLTPIGTPAAITRKLESDLRTVLARPELITRFAQLGAFPGDLTGEQVVTFAKSEQDMWRPILERLANDTK
jgi:tripartite-type tricarboxylate transporter receptor subunit TctC